MVLLFHDRTKELALSTLSASLTDTPIEHWREDPICAAFLGEYERFDPIVDGLSDALIQSVMRAVLKWANDPETFSTPEIIEEFSWGEVEYWLAQELPRPITNWLHELNHRTSRLLDAYFSQVLGRNSVGFPLLPMGELQLQLAREITYDLTLMTHDRIKSYCLPQIFRIPPKYHSQIHSRGHHLAHYAGWLADFLEAERLELRLRLNTYLLNRDFLALYRDCVLSAARQWTTGWRTDPHWGGLLPFTIRTAEEDEQLTQDVIEYMDQITADDTTKSDE